MKSGVQIRAVLRLPGLDEGAVGADVQIRLILPERDHADRDVAQALQLGVLSDVARADQAHAGLAHAEVGVGLEHRARVAAGGHEDVEAVRPRVLDPLHERREVGHLGRPAHGDGVDDLTARLLEPHRECRERILARRVVGIADRGRRAAERLGGVASPIGNPVCHMLMETRARCGDRFGIQAVAAFMIKVGTLACSISALATLTLALSANRCSVSRSTSSRTISAAAGAASARADARSTSGGGDADA